MNEYQLFFSPEAAKSLRGLLEKIKRRIDEKLVALIEEPRPFGTIKLQGSDSSYRIRIGDYRVVYSIEDKKLFVLILKIAHRKEVYR